MDRLSPRRECEQTKGVALKWRGHISHVSSGERRYLDDLDSIAAFIALYLEEMAGAGCKPAQTRDVSGPVKDTPRSQTQVMEALAVPCSTT